MAKNLTAKAVEAATAGTSRREIPDGLLPGLYLVVQPSGAKSWAIRYRHAGKPRKMTLGPVAPKLDGPEPAPTLGVPLTLAGARTIAREQLRIVAAGRDPAAEHVTMKRAARDPATVDRDLFGTVARTFVKRYAKPKNKSWRETARLLGLRPDPENDGDLVTIGGGLADPKQWGKRRVQEITRREIIDLLDGTVDRGAPVVANATLAALRKMFNWAVERGILDASPAAGVKPPASVKSRDRVLSDDELAAIWRTARSTPYPFGPAVRLLILTGARREEINALRRGEIDGDTIRLAGDRTKNGEPHDIPLSAEARQVLDALPLIGKGGLAFTTTGETPVSGWSKAKRVLDHASGVEGWRIHDLRRTVATDLQRLGFRLEVIESVLGHVGGSRAGIVGVYQRHAFEPEKREALDAWGRYVALLGRPRTWAKVRAHLDAGDVAEGERQAVRRERDREFCRLIATGGKAWSRYVVGIARRGETKAALKEGVKRIESARDWLREHDADYMNVAMSYLHMGDRSPPDIGDYVASLDALVAAIHRATEHEASRTRHGPTAWAGHKLAVAIAAVLQGAGYTVDARRGGLLVRTVAVAIEEAGRCNPTIRRLDPNENAKDWTEFALNRRGE